MVAARIEPTVKAAIAIMIIAVTSTEPSRFERML